jgi:hypothetical protein
MLPPSNVSEEALGEVSDVGVVSVAYVGIDPWLAVKAMLRTKPSNPFLRFIKVCGVLDMRYLTLF